MKKDIMKNIANKSFNLLTIEYREKYFYHKNLYDNGCRLCKKYHLKKMNFYEKKINEIDELCQSIL